MNGMVLVMFVFILFIVSSFCSFCLKVNFTISFLVPASLGWGNHHLVEQAWKPAIPLSKNAAGNSALAEKV